MKKYNLVFFLILTLITFLVIHGNAFALYEDDYPECRDYPYGKEYTSNIGRKGKVIRCGSVVPNPIYGFAIEVRWDDDPNGKISTYEIPRNGN